LIRLWKLPSGSTKEANYLNFMIEGVTTKKIIKHSDERGFFTELVKFGENTFHKIMQTSYSETKPGVIKAFHLHDYWEIWCVIKGRAKVVLYDMRPDSPTKKQTEVIYTGEDDMSAIAIPPGVGHGYEALGDSNMGIIYHSEEAYDPNNITIKNIPPESPEINLDWKNLK